jgi:hypothetical protein
MCLVVALLHCSTADVRLLANSMQSGSGLRGTTSVALKYKLAWHVMSRSDVCCNLLSPVAQRAPAL